MDQEEPSQQAEEWLLPHQLLATLLEQAFHCPLVVYTAIFHSSN